MAKFGPLPEVSEQHLRFIEEYCKDKNGTRAALAAGLTSNPQSARVIAARLLADVSIKRWVRKLLREQAKRLKFNPGKVLRNWMLAAHADQHCFVITDDGRLETAPGVPREFIRAVRKWKWTKTVRVKDQGRTLEEETRGEVELRDPFGPECKLMEHFGALPGEGVKGGGVSVEVVGRILAHFADRLAPGGGGGAAAGSLPPGGAVAGEPGAAGPSLPEPGG